MDKLAMKMVGKSIFDDAFDEDNDDGKISGDMLRACLAGKGKSV